MRAVLLALTLTAIAGVAWAGEADWSPFVLDAAGRKLAAAMPAGSGPVLTVVIEGDGAAHDGRGRPTADPTPRRPIGLALARSWPAPVAWLGRLCQQVQALDPGCTPADWTHARYSEAAVRAADAAIDALKARAGADQLVLVGWSGGGVLAALLAGRRMDVAGLITVAAPPGPGRLDSAPGALAPDRLPRSCGPAAR